MRPQRSFNRPSKLGLERLEVRDNPTTGLFAVAADATGGPRVTVYNPNGTVRYDFLAYPASLTTGVRVATGDVTGDGVEDIITAPGPGGGPDVRVWDGASAGPTPTMAYNFLAFAPSDQLGLYVAAGDVNADGRKDVVVSGLSGSSPIVVVRSGLNPLGLPIRQINLPGPSGAAYPVAAGDVNGDGFSDVIVGSPVEQTTADDVQVFSGASVTPLRLLAFSTPSSGFDPQNAPRPVFVASGDLTGDGRAEVIISVTNYGSPASIKVYNPAGAGSMTTVTNPFSPFNGQVRVAAGDVNGDGRDDILFAAGPTGGPRVTARDYLTGTSYQDFLAFGGTFFGGLYVG